MNNNIKIAKQLLKIAKSLVATNSIPDTPEEMAHLVAEELGWDENKENDLLHDINNLRDDEWYEEIKEEGYEKYGDSRLLDIYDEFIERYSGQKLME